MTHEDLLADIKNSCPGKDICKNCCALLAVVELHKPRDYDGWKIGGNWCVGCNADFEYPCPTISAIEKELR